MPTPYDDWKKDGLDRLIKLARLMCTLVNSFAKVIETKYADYPNIQALLVAIKAVCAMLPPAQADFEAFGSDDGLPPSDTSTIPGINPSAPAAPDIEVS